MCIQGDYFGLTGHQNNNNDNNNNPKFLGQQIQE